MKHVMLDLETLGVGYDAAVVTIGACEFDPFSDKLGEMLYRKVDPQSSVTAGLKIDASTILWWMAQSDAARKQTFADENDRMPLQRACFALNDFIRPVNGSGDVAVWGNGATFDNVVIRSAFRAVDVHPCWSFRNDRCYRTVINLVPKEQRPAFENHGTVHNALDDAVAQAKYLQKIYGVLGLKE